MNHRDTMNTEKNKNPEAKIGSPIGDFSDRHPPSFFSVPQRCNILARRADLAVSTATIRTPENGRRRLALRPGGTPQEISRGQVHASGRGPRSPRRTGHAPAGHRRSFWRREPRSFSATTRRLGPVRPPVIGQRPGLFLRCPAGARNHSTRFPGAASAGADLPPANLLRRPSGTGTGRPCTDEGKPPGLELRSQLVRLRPRGPVFIAPPYSSRRFPLRTHG